MHVYSDDDSDGDNEGDWDDRPWERQELENFAKKGYLAAQKKRISVLNRRSNSAGKIIQAMD